MGKTLVKLALAIFFITCACWNNRAEGEKSFPVIGYSVFLRPVAEVPEGAAILASDISDFEVWCWNKEHQDKKIVGYLNKDSWELRNVSNLEHYGADRRVYDKR